MSDSWDITTGPASSGAGFNLGGLGQLLRPLGSLLRPSDPLETVRLRLALLELAKATSGGVVGWRDVGSLANVVPAERQDWCLLGSRGAGKTATGVWIAQHLARVLEVPAVALGWPIWAAERVGLKSVPTLDRLSDCVVFVDEAGLRLKPGKRDEALSEMVALARHENLSLIWTSQSAAGIHRDVLRQDVRVAWLRVEPVQVRFDREELADLLAQVVSIQGSSGGPWPAGRLCIPAGTGWVSAQSPLPAGWDEEVSKLWRRKR